MVEGWEVAQRSRSHKAALDTDWRKTLLTIIMRAKVTVPARQLLCTPAMTAGLDGLAKDIAELGVSVPGETKFRQDEHSNWDAVCQHHLHCG